MLDIQPATVDEAELRMPPVTVASPSESDAPKLVVPPMVVSDLEPPPPEPVTRVTSISMWANKLKGKRTVWAYVWVDDEYWDDAAGATVFVDWTFPNGKTQRLEADTSSSGVARWEMPNGKTGTHTLEVVDVVFGEHRFDRENSTLTYSIKVK